MAIKYGGKSASNKELKKFLKLIRSAGGRIEPTKRGHFKIYGPNGGLAIISPITSDPRQYKNAVMQVQRDAGLDLNLNRGKNR
jgi:hypothetical protein